MSEKQNIEIKTAELASLFWEFNKNSKYDIARILLSEMLSLYSTCFKCSNIDRNSEYHTKQFIEVSEKYTNISST